MSEEREESQAASCGLDAMEDFRAAQEAAEEAKERFEAAEERFEAAQERFDEADESVGDAAADYFSNVVGGAMSCGMAAATGDESLGAQCAADIQGFQDAVGAAVDGMQEMGNAVEDMEAANEEMSEAVEDLKTAGDEMGDALEARNEQCAVQGDG